MEEARGALVEDDEEAGAGGVAEGGRDGAAPEGAQAAGRVERAQGGESGAAGGGGAGEGEGRLKVWRREMRLAGGERADLKRLGGVKLTSDRVLRRVNGMRTKPTPVRAELPTIRSPAGVSLALPPTPLPAALKVDDFATNARRRERVKK